MNASIPSSPRILDIGCGRDKLPGAVGIDVNSRSSADIIHDLDVYPWPLESDSFEFVRAQDVLEHVADFMRCMEEIHRVCCDGAVVDVRLPFMTSPHFATDPTHRRAATSRTFDYFDPSKPLGAYQYSKARFEVLWFRYERGYTGNVVGKTLKLADRVLVPFLEKHSVDYEHFFAGIYPMHNVHFHLRALKSR